MKIESRYAPDRATMETEVIPPASPVTESITVSEMAARASLFRTESRWGLYHYRLDYPEMDNEHWFVHSNLKQGSDGTMTFYKRPVTPYVIALDADELLAYHRLRIPAEQHVEA